MSCFTTSTLNALFFPTLYFVNFFILLIPSWCFSFFLPFSQLKGLSFLLSCILFSHCYSFLHFHLYYSGYFYTFHFSIKTCCLLDFERLATNYCPGDLILSFIISSLKVLILLQKGSGSFLNT